MSSPLKQPSTTKKTLNGKQSQELTNCFAIIACSELEYHRRMCGLLDKAIVIVERDDRFISSLSGSGGHKKLSVLSEDDRALIDDLVTQTEHPQKIYDEFTNHTHKSLDEYMQLLELRQTWHPVWPPKKKRKRKSTDAVVKKGKKKERTIKSKSKRESK